MFTIQCTVHLYKRSLLYVTVSWTLTMSCILMHSVRRWASILVLDANDTWLEWCDVIGCYSLLLNQERPKVDVFWGGALQPRLYLAKTKIGAVSPDVVQRLVSGERRKCNQLQLLTVTSSDLCETVFAHDGDRSLDNYYFLLYYWLSRFIYFMISWLHG